MRDVVSMLEHMGGGFGWGGWLLVVLLVLLLLLVVAGLSALIAWAVQRSNNATPSSSAPGSGPPEAQSPALQMLDERFAFGDIDEDDYVRRRTVLRGW